jgi:SMC interacting uncharacterized protein involved in chromosome segregation
MGHELDQVSVEIGRLTAKVETMESHIDGINGSLCKVNEKLDSMMQEKRDMRAKILGVGAGIGIAGSTLAQGVKSFFDHIAR